MQITGIDWTDYSWNPITGCCHGCRKIYCYAAKMAAWRGDDFSPKFHEEQLDTTVNLKAGIVFQGSNGDSFGKWVPREWIEKVIAAEQANPRVAYMNLTKNPQRYMEFAEDREVIKGMDENIWLGTTLDQGYSAPEGQVPQNKERIAALDLLEYPRKFFSIEPFNWKLVDWYKEMLGNMDVQWIIIGFMSKPSPKGLTRRDYSMVEMFVDWIKAKGIPVFVKDSIAMKDVRPFPAKWPREFPYGVKLATKSAEYTVTNQTKESQQQLF